MSVVGQHMQQAGATPAEAMAFTLSSAIQYADDCIARGMDPDEFLPRFTFFFDISISFFEEIAKFRAGRRIWARIARERLGAKDPRSWRFKFHGQTSGVDLTRQQPLNNIARVTAQAMAGIFGGLQSLHTDSYDEVFSVPTRGRRAHRRRDPEHPARGSAPHRRDRSARRLVLRRELTDEMEEKIEAIIATIDAAGGMCERGRERPRAADDRRVGAARSSSKIEAGEQVVVGVNKYQADENAGDYPRARVSGRERSMQRRSPRSRAFKAARSRRPSTQALDALARARRSGDGNVFGAVVEAADAGATHGEICACLRRELGFGQPLGIV